MCKVPTNMSIIDQLSKSNKQFHHLFFLRNAVPKIQKSLTKDQEFIDSFSLIPFKKLLTIEF